MEEGQSGPGTSSPPEKAGHDPDPAPAAPAPVVFPDFPLVPLAHIQPKLDLYRVESYTFATKEEHPCKSDSVIHRLERMRSSFPVEGMRRSVDAVLLVHQHNHPHLLVLQLSQTYFRLPGGKCRPGEDEVECLKRKLHRRLSPAAGFEQPEWESCWECGRAPVLRISSTRTVLHTFRDPRSARRCVFSVPQNYRLLAVPLFELHENAKRYGSKIASIPIALSRFNVNFVS